MVTKSFISNKNKNHFLLIILLEFFFTVLQFGTNLTFDFPENDNQDLPQISTLKELKKIIEIDVYELDII